MVNQFIIRNIYFFIIFVLICIHFILGLDTIKHNSVTFDEHVHLTAGYSYLKTGKYYLNILDHPPISKMYSALPLLLMNPMLLTNHPYWLNYQQYSFADLFIYNNKVDAERMLNSSRIMMLILSCILGILIFLWAKRLYGISSGIFALILYLFNSNFIAHGTLVTTDLSLSIFYFLSIYIFWCWINNPRIITVVILGITTALTLTTKFSGILIFIVYIFLLLLPNVKEKNRLSPQQFRSQVCLFFITVLTSVFSIYKIKYIGLYIQGLENIFKSVNVGRAAFLMGDYSNTGWLHYFLITFLIKTPIPFLILLILSLILQFRNLLKIDKVILLLPVLVYFLFSSISKQQIGLRYILPIYPFLFIFVSEIINNVSIKNRLNLNFYFKFFIITLFLVWYIYSCIKIHPWHISYFNEIIGGPENGYKFLTDSNIDWGQGLKELGNWYKKNNLKGIYLSYFGTGDPHYYGIKYIPIGFVNPMLPEMRSGDKISFSSKDNIFFAISVTNLQATYYENKKVFNWLKEIRPYKIISYSIFIYDLTDKPFLLKNLYSTF